MYKKGVSLVLSLSLVFGGYGSSPVSANSLPDSLVSRIQIPSHLGQKGQVLAGSSPLTVIHIQDAHGNYEGQQNIEKLLEYLNQNYSIQNVFLEGAAAPLNPKALDYFEDQSLNLEIANLLLKNGKLTGPEMFLLKQRALNHAIPEFRGIENEALYRTNHDLLRQALNLQEAQQSFLKTFRLSVNLLESRLFSNNLRNFVKEWRLYLEDSSNLPRYLRYLETESRQSLGLDLGDACHQDSYGNILRFLKLKSLGSDLEPGRLEQEYQEALSFLNSKQLFHASELLVSLKPDASAIKSASYPRFILEEVAAEGRDQGFDLSRYPQLMMWMKSLAFQSEIDSPGLFQETESLTEQVLDSLAISPQEKSLLHLIRDEVLLEKLLSLELSSKDYGRVEARGEEISPSQMIARLRSLLPESLKIQSVPRSVTKLFRDGHRFYEMAIDRENGFISQILPHLKGPRPAVFILVTGGFHELGMVSQLRHKNISYISFYPKIGEVEKGHQTYLNAVMGRVKPRIESEMVEALTLQSDEDRERLVGSDSQIEHKEIEASAIAAVLEERKLPERYARRLAEFIIKKDLRQLPSSVLDPDKRASGASLGDKTLAEILSEIDEIRDSFSENLKEEKIVEVEKVEKAKEVLQKPLPQPAPTSPTIKSRPTSKLMLFAAGATLLSAASLFTTFDPFNAHRFKVQLATLLTRISPEMATDERIESLVFTILKDEDHRGRRVTLTELENSLKGLGLNISGSWKDRLRTVLKAPVEKGRLRAGALADENSWFAVPLAVAGERDKLIPEFLQSQNGRWVSADEARNFILKELGTNLVFKGRELEGVDAASITTSLTAGADRGDWIFRKSTGVPDSYGIPGGAEDSFIRETTQKLLNTKLGTRFSIEEIIANALDQKQNSFLPDTHLFRVETGQVITALQPLVAKDDIRSVEKGDEIEGYLIPQMFPKKGIQDAIRRLARSSPGRVFEIPELLRFMAEQVVPEKVRALGLSEKSFKAVTSEDIAQAMAEELALDRSQPGGSVKRRITETGKAIYVWTTPASDETLKNLALTWSRDKKEVITPQDFSQILQGMPPQYEILTEDSTLLRRFESMIQSLYLNQADTQKLVQILLRSQGPAAFTSPQITQLLREKVLATTSEWVLITGNHLPPKAQTVKTVLEGFVKSGELFVESTGSQGEKTYSLFKPLTPDQARVELKNYLNQNQILALEKKDISKFNDWLLKRYKGFKSEDLMQWLSVSADSIERGVLVYAQSKPNDFFAASEVRNAEWLLRPDSPEIDEAIQRLLSRDLLVDRNEDGQRPTASDIPTDKRYILAYPDRLVSQESDVTALSVDPKLIFKKIWDRDRQALLDAERSGDPLHYENLGRYQGDLEDGRQIVQMLQRYFKEEKREANGVELNSIALPLVRVLRRYEPFLSDPKISSQMTEAQTLKFLGNVANLILKERWRMRNRVILGKDVDLVIALSSDMPWTEEIKKYVTENLQEKFGVSSVKILDARGKTPDKPAGDVAQFKEDLFKVVRDYRASGKRLTIWPFYHGNKKGGALGDGVSIGYMDWVKALTGSEEPLSKSSRSGINAENISIVCDGCFQYNAAVHALEELNRRAQETKSKIVPPVIITPANMDHTGRAAVDKSVWISDLQLEIFAGNLSGFYGGYRNSLMLDKNRKQSSFRLMDMVRLDKRLSEQGPNKDAAIFRSIDPDDFLGPAKELMDKLKLPHVEKEELLQKLKDTGAYIEISLGDIDGKSSPYDQYDFSRGASLGNAVEVGVKEAEDYLTTHARPGLAAALKVAKQMDNIYFLPEASTEVRDVFTLRLFTETTSQLPRSVKLFNSSDAFRKFITNRIIQDKTSSEELPLIVSEDLIKDFDSAHVKRVLGSLSEGDLLVLPYIKSGTMRTTPKAIQLFLNTGPSASLRTGGELAKIRVQALALSGPDALSAKLKGLLKSFQGIPEVVVNTDGGSDLMGKTEGNTTIQIQKSRLIGVEPDRLLALIRDLSDNNLEVRKRLYEAVQFDVAWDAAKKTIRVSIGEHFLQFLEQLAQEFLSSTELSQAA